MITIARVKQATKNFIKVLRMGRNDVQTAYQSSGWGIDSKPVKNTLAIHVKTANKSESVVIGYINQSDKTNEGETRIYATNDAGVEVFSIYLKNNGTVEIGGNTDNAVKHAALNTSLQQFVLDVNTQLTTALALVPYTWVPVTLNISSAKVDDVKF